MNRSTHLWLASISRTEQLRPMLRVRLCPEHGARTESIYLRPTNGRADDQLRRNHSVQYDSVPDFPWFRLRKESPGVYESYTDLEAGEWSLPGRSRAPT
jgi:hypothetical protein